MHPFGMSRQDPKYTDAMRALRSSNQLSEFSELTIKLVYRDILYAGDWAVDGGAGLGLHTIAMAISAGPTGKVIAFEPVAATREKLKAAAAEHLAPRNLFEVVEFRSEALSNKSQQIDFTVVDSSLGYSSLRLAWAPKDSKTHIEEVIAIRLDDALGSSSRDKSDTKARLRFIKLDLQGGEFWALKGAEETLRASRPVVAFELGRRATEVFGFSPKEFFDFFSENKYELYCVFFLPFLPADWRLPYDELPSNFFAFPKEQRPGATFARVGDAHFQLYHELVDRDRSDPPPKSAAF